MLREVDVEKKVTETFCAREEILKTYTEYIEKEKDPVIITQTKNIDIPFLLEKIVEKVTVMPQVVEVLKCVYDICEDNNITALCELDLEVKEYKELSIILEKEMALFF